MKTYLRNFLRNVFGPRSVASQVKRLRVMADDLNEAGRHHEEQAQAFYRKAHAAETEADRAARVSAKISDLIS